MSPSSQTIISPVPFVKTATFSYCTECDSDGRKTFEHAFYPGMKVCASCLDDHHAKSSHPYELKTDRSAWDSIAEKQGRELSHNWR